MSYCLIAACIIGGGLAGLLAWALCRIAALADTYKMHHEEGEWTSDK